MTPQHVLGTKDLEIYPYIRKIDLMSSNSYILSGSDQIAVVDPGGLEEQIESLDREIIRLQEEMPRPVLVYLTHVHLDHWIQLKQCHECRALNEAALAAQEVGAKALEAGDPNITLSKLLGRRMTRVPVEMKLLSDLDKVIGGQQTFDIDGWSLDYTNHTKSVDGFLLQSQSVSLGKHDLMEVYHTPGHSPDSICLRAGSLLIVGDIFFAPNPGMAGAYGWSKQDLMESIQKVLWILEKENIHLCCSGHGRPIDAETAKKTLTVMYRDAAALEGIEEISPEWSKRTSDYARDLMGELERIFTIIAGRLAFIAYVLAELEEKSEAEEIVSLLSAEKIDEMFSDFNSFAAELRSGRKLDIEMVHKTGQIVGRLEGLFEKKKLGSVIDKSLLRRAGRLLSDYSTVYRGFRPPYYVEYADIHKLVGEILEKVRHDSYENTAILETESEEDYLRALKARIANVNLFEDVDLAFEHDSNNPFANLDRERFSDTFIDILERFAAAGAGKIKIVTDLNDDWRSLRIDGFGTMSGNPAGGRSQRFFERNLSLCGGLMQASSGADGAAVEIEFYSRSDDQAIQHLH